MCSGFMYHYMLAERGRKRRLFQKLQKEELASHATPEALGQWQL